MQAKAKGPSSRSRHDVEHLLQKIDRVEAAISSAEAMGQAAKQQVDAELGGSVGQQPAAIK